MMYEFNEKIVNLDSNLDNFYHSQKFVGYILPNGEIYQTENHNVSNIQTAFMTYLALLKEHFEDKKSILGETDDLIGKIIVKFFRRISLEELLALDTFINQNNLSFSSLLVGLFGCHLITRLDKSIITSDGNHAKFYNYLLNDFKIHTIDKIVYDSKKKAYVFIKNHNMNLELYSDIDKVKREVDGEDINLFVKK